MHIDAQAAVRYFLRLIVQDAEGETFFVTSVSCGSCHINPMLIKVLSLTHLQKELILFRDVPPEVLSEEVPRTHSSNSAGSLVAGGASKPSYNNEHVINL